MKLPVPDTLLPADQLGTVHFVGIGGSEGAVLSGIARPVVDAPGGLAAAATHVITLDIPVDVDEKLSDVILEAGR